MITFFYVFFVKQYLLVLLELICVDIYVYKGKGLRNLFYILVFIFHVVGGTYGLSQCRCFRRQSVLVEGEYRNIGPGLELIIFWGSCFSKYYGSLFCSKHGLLYMYLKVRAWRIYPYYWISDCMSWKIDMLYRIVLVLVKVKDGF